MTALPWVSRQQIEPSRDYVVMASKLPLRQHRSIPGFLRDTMAVRSQLGQASGLVGYALDADLPGKTFWTFSVWQDRASLDAFAGSEPHRRIVARLAPLMDDTRFEFREQRGSEIPASWSDRKAMLAGRAG